MSYVVSYFGGFTVVPSLSQDQVKAFRDFSICGHANPLSITNNGSLIYIEDGLADPYGYQVWLDTLIKKIFRPQGCEVTGKIKTQSKPLDFEVMGRIYWYGEDSRDLGTICVNGGIVSIQEGKIINEENSQEPEDKPKPKSITQTFENENYIIKVVDGKATVTPKGRFKAAIQIGMHILDGNCIFSNRFGTRMKLDASFDYHDNLSSLTINSI